MHKIIGILGGMGPAATIDLFQKIVLNTPASKDQDHLQILIYNNPKIPPRSNYSDISSESPLNELKKSAILLEKSGADFIIMPCHTAHIWFEDIKKVINIPFYSMIDNTVQVMINRKDFIKKEILLLATETTIKSKLYQKAFGYSYGIITPNTHEQKTINRIIEYIKSGKINSNQNIDELNQILCKYKIEGINLVLGGCTEIPLIFPYLKIDIEKIDPTLMLAQLAIDKAK